MALNSPFLPNDDIRLVEEFDLKIEVNGQIKSISTTATTKLVFILREVLNLTGTKWSCGIGRCGACTVLMNGRAVNSCMILAYQAQNQSFTTIEGVSLLASTVDIQSAIAAEGALQCGYCTPGMVMAAHAVFIEYPHPTEKEIFQGLSGNLCRCTGYASIVRALASVRSR